jgi:pimeloyl-ACP methyl ester carboxylesterase
MIEAYERANVHGALYPPALVAECAQLLRATADLSMYSTAVAARDIEQIREALGYEQFDLTALSYGTTLAMRYIAEFPERVRSAALMAVVPAARTPPRYHAAAADRALTMLLADCAADAACNAAFPAIDADLERTLERLRGAAATLSPAIFLEKIRTLMYTPASARQIPFLIHRAAQGDFEPLLAATKPTGARPFADGLYLSITCAETFQHIDIDAAIAAAAATRFGPYRLERQQAACKEWPQAAPDPKLYDTFKSNTPVLLISGAMDPVSPPEWAAEAAASYPNSRHIVVPHGAHLFDGLSQVASCLDKLLLDFVAAGSAESLDAACVEQMKPPSYRTS